MFFSSKFSSLSAGILLDKPKVPSESLEAHVEPELISAVTKLLDDRNPQVRVAAAITLYSLKKHNDNVSFTKCLCDFLTSYTDLLSGHHGIFLLGWKDCVTSIIALTRGNQLAIYRARYGGYPGNIQYVALASF